MQWLIPILAQAAALFRIWTLPGPRFRWFGAYLVATLVRSVALWLTSAPSNRSLYADIWGYSEPVMAALWTLMALELYVRVSGLYQGLSRPGIASIALGVAMLATWLTLIEPHSNRLQNIFLLRRVTASVLALAIGVLAMLFGYFRNSLPRNSVAHAGVMAFYFVSQAAGYFAANATGEVIDWGAVASWGAIASYAGWALLLTPAGELRPAVMREFTDLEIAHADELEAELIRRAQSMGRGSTRD